MNETTQQYIVQASCTRIFSSGRVPEQRLVQAHFAHTAALQLIAEAA